MDVVAFEALGRVRNLCPATGNRNTINDSEDPVFPDLRVGATYRLRFMNIAVGRPGTRVSSLRDGQPVQPVR